MLKKPSDFNSIQDTTRKGKDLIHLLETAPGSLGKQIIDDRYHHCIATRENDKVRLPHAVECNGCESSE
mgnify:CR=1 FL=1